MPTQNELPQAALEIVAQYNTYAMDWNQRKKEFVDLVKSIEPLLELEIVPFELRRELEVSTAMLVLMGRLTIELRVSVLHMLKNILLPQLAAVFEYVEELNLALSDEDIIAIPEFSIVEWGQVQPKSQLMQ